MPVYPGFFFALGNLGERVLSLNRRILPGRRVADPVYVPEKRLVPDSRISIRVGSISMTQWRPSPARGPNRHARKGPKPTP